MTIESSIAFVLTMSLFVASPGPGVMACVSVAMRRNVKNSIAFLIGLIMGDLVFVTFAVYGLTALATNFGTLFYAVRVLGGIYLFYLAFKMWKASPSEMTANAPSRKRSSAISAFLITISNPKVIVFYCGFLPNFMDITALKGADIVIVCLLVAFVITVVMGTYTVIAYKTGGFISKKSGRMLNRAGGTALAVTGTYLIFKR